MDPSTFLDPKLRDLHSPDTLPGARDAARLLCQAVKDGVGITIYGDYDVDGITGVSILWQVLQRAGAAVDFYLPHRLEEGYGVNVAAVRTLAQHGTKVLVTVDCGITAVEAVELAKSLGMTVIVTDHHEWQDPLPAADAIVHPRLGEGGANPDLSGSGVAHKLAWAVAQELSGGDRVGAPYRDLLMQLLGLAALGTVADVVPLTGENRIICRHGLSMVGSLGRLEDSSVLPGLAALIDASGLNGQRVSAYDVGFKLGPRLNAAGRMGHARLAVELFTRASPERAREIAMYLNDQNRVRQTTERQTTNAAKEQVERMGLHNDTARGIVVAAEGWHAGVIGIVAARLVDAFHRPAVVIGIDGEIGQGSARSIPGFSMYDALSHCGEHLETFGGHAMAAGLRVKHDRVQALRDSFVAYANATLTGRDMRPKLRLDGEVAVADLTLEAVDTLARLGPHGMGNPRPRFASGWLELTEEPKCVGRDGAHLSARFRENGLTVRAIGFGLGERIEDLRRHRRCRVAFEPMVNEFNGRRSVEMQVVDIQFPD
jgi:single-stranded-DNA-specific exonuclease